MVSCEATHREQAQHNFDLAKELADQTPLKYKDWSLIIAFYAAIHFVEAIMALEGSHSETDNHPHIFRRDWVEQKSKLSKDARKVYLKLYQLSMSLRYLRSECRGMTKGQWLKDSTVRKIVKSDFRVLNSEVDALLAS